MKAFPKYHNENVSSLPPSLSLLGMAGFIRVQPHSGNSAYLRTFTSTAAPAQTANFSFTTQHSCIHFLSFQMLVYCQFTEPIIVFHSIYKKEDATFSMSQTFNMTNRNGKSLTQIWKRCQEFFNEKEHIIFSAASRTLCARANAFQCLTTKLFPSLTLLRKKTCQDWTM